LTNLFPFVKKQLILKTSPDGKNMILIERMNWWCWVKKEEEVCPTPL
jgi:hypothetical protein